MAITGYRKSHTDEVRCVDHADFSDGTPVYGELECAYCPKPPAPHAGHEDRVCGTCGVCRDCHMSEHVMLAHRGGVCTMGEGETFEAARTEPSKTLVSYDHLMGGYLMVLDGVLQGVHYGSERGARMRLGNIKDRMRADAR